MEITASPKQAQHTVSFGSGMPRLDDTARSMQAFLAVACAALPVLSTLDCSIITPPSFIDDSEDFATFNSHHLSLTQSVSGFVSCIVPLFEDELAAISEAALFSVRWVGPEAYVALSAEVVPIVRNAFHLRSESVKKKRRRDRLRCTVAELHKHTSQAAAECLSSGAAPSLLGRWDKYISGTRSFLEIEGDNDLPDLDDLRVNFGETVASLCRRISVDAVYLELFTDEVRTDLFTLFSQWCTSGDGTDSSSRKMLDFSSSLAKNAVAAISALCRGRIFDHENSVENRAYVLSFLLFLRFPYFRPTNASADICFGGLSRPFLVLTTM